MNRKQLCLISIIGVVVLSPPAARADDAARPNVVSIQGGAQIELAQYSTFLKLGAGWSRWLSEQLWLDLGSTVLVHRETDWAVSGGVRWKFGRTPSGVRGFVRTALELAVLRRDAGSRFAMGLRAGGGAGYYSSEDFGATVEASTVLGPAFGDGVHFAAAIDLLLGVEFLF